MDRLYERTTKRCTPSQLDAALRAEVAAHAAAHQLGDVLGAAVNCYETWSVRLRKPGLLSRLTGSGDQDTEHRTVVVIAPRYVVVAVEGKRRGVHVLSARLDGVRLSESSELQRLARETATSAGRFGTLPLDDFGVSVTALWSGALGRVSKVASSARRAGSAASGGGGTSHAFQAVGEHRKAEGRPRTGRTRTIPTTRRGAVPGVVDQTGLSKHALEAASFYIGVSDDLEGRAFLGEFHSAVTRAKST